MIPDIRMYGFMPSNPNKIYTLNEISIRTECVHVVVQYNGQWDTQRRRRLLTGVVNWIEMKVKHKKLEDQIEDSPNPRKVQNKWGSCSVNNYFKGRTQTSVFNFMSRVSIAELVYEVSKIDSPLINNDFTACTIVYVLPVPGIPNIRA